MKAKPFMYQIYKGHYSVKIELVVILVVCHQSKGPGPDPEHSNTGGIECGRHDVSGIRCKGGEYERGCPPLIWGSGGYPPGKKWEIVVPEKRF